MAGRKINDHGFWAGGKSKDSIMPEGVKVKHQPAGSGEGELSRYQDTSEEVHAAQMAGNKKIRGHMHNPENRQ